MRNSTTRESLAADGTWGITSNRRQLPDLADQPNAALYNWSWTTPFTLTPGTTRSRCGDRQPRPSTSSQPRARDHQRAVPRRQRPGRADHHDRHGQRRPGPAPRSGRHRHATTRVFPRSGSRSRRRHRPLRAAERHAGGGFRHSNADLAAPSDSARTGRCRSTFRPPATMPCRCRLSTPPASPTRRRPGPRPVSDTTPATPRRSRRRCSDRPNGTVFTDGRIIVTGRLEDDQQIAGSRWRSSTLPGST